MQDEDLRYEVSWK